VVVVVVHIQWLEVVVVVVAGGVVVVRVVVVVCAVVVLVVVVVCGEVVRVLVTVGDTGSAVSSVVVVCTVVVVAEVVVIVGGVIAVPVGGSGGPAVVAAVVTVVTVPVVFCEAVVEVPVDDDAVVSPETEVAVVTEVVVSSVVVTIAGRSDVVVVCISEVVTGSFVGISVMRSLPPLKRLLSRDTAERIASLFQRPTPRRIAHPRAAAAMMFLRMMIRFLFCLATYSSRRSRTRSAISSYDLILKSLLFKH